MIAIKTPEVTFSLQSVAPAFPCELHEAIDLTPDLISFAESMLPAAENLYNAAQAAERMSLKISDGESLWRAADGPNNAMRADRAALLHDQLRMLADGRNHSRYLGWIDRRDWDSIVRTFA